MAAWTRHRLFPLGFLAIACALLTLLWLPGLKYPVVSDTSVYALLGKSLWTTGTYALFGLPYAKHLPMLPMLSYPLVAFAGFHLGMKLATLLAGFGILGMSFAIARRRFGLEAAMLTVAALLLHPAFLLMTMLGSADLLFTFLFLGAVLFYVAAETDTRWYLLMGLAAGMMCLTRYNGFPVLLVLPAAVGIARRTHLRTRPFWGGLALAFGLPSLWFLRNWIAFGSPLHTEYTAELATEAPDHLHQLFSNAVYYLNPLHNILPVLLLLSFYGLWRYARREAFLTVCMLAVWALTAVWWVQAMRFAFPGYVILLMFSAAAITDLRRRAGAWSLLVTAFLGFGIAVTHVPALCLYTYGECNAWYDAHLGGIPPNMGLTPEGFYAWHLARERFNVLADSGAVLVADDPLNGEVWKTGVFRPDIRVQAAPTKACGYYRITQHPDASDQVLFTTFEAPATSVVRKTCP
jgi:4-amino-4-deoxy-L-arabinose transferase-like glycosyltransferase